MKKLTRVSSRPIFHLLSLFYFILFYYLYTFRFFHNNAEMIFCPYVLVNSESKLDSLSDFFKLLSGSYRWALF